MPMAFSQTDNVLWASVQLRKKFSPKWSLQVQPIVRYDENISSYQNSSLDISLRRNLGPNWHLQVLSRTWAIPNGNTRQFLWLDVAYKTKVPSLNISVINRLRYHQAFDTGPNIDQDYLRYIVQIVPTTSWKLKPTIAYERWFILNDVNVFRRFRIEPGLRYQFNDTYGLTGIWRRESDINDVEDIIINRNLWVVALVYNFK